MERVKNAPDYYSKIINLRILFEGKYRSNIYQYLSAILHMTCRNDLDICLNNKKMSENEILDHIKEEFKVTLDIFNDTVYSVIDVEKYTLLEKIALYREAEKIGLDRPKQCVRDEINNILHINSRLIVCLNPQKYEFITDLLRINLDTFIEKFKARCN